MADRPSAEWFHEFFPAIAASGGWGGDPCWIAWAKTQDAEHNPPFFWLGLALDVLAEGGYSEWLRLRLRTAHGPGSCRGQRGRDGIVQDLLTEACAFAWARERLGEPVVEPLAEGGPEDLVPVRLYVPAHGAYIAPRRLQPRSNMEQVFQNIAEVAASADEAMPRGTLPDGAGRILYSDVWHDRMYHQGVGYRLEVTEPVQAAVSHFAREHHLGYVLTRPFEWGRPIAAHY